MACEAWRDKLDAFVDGELSPNAQQEFDAHLRGCASCAKDIASRMQLKTAVKRAAALRYAPSVEFRRKIEKEALPRKRNPRAVLIWAPAFAAAAVVLLVIVWMARRPAVTPEMAMLGEVVDMHVTALASANPVDVVSTDQHTVKPWFEGKLPFAVNLPDLTNSPFTLLGGRVAYLDQTPGAGLLFQYRKHQLSVFIFQERAEWAKMSAKETPQRHASFWVETWSASGLRYFVVGDTSDANVEQLANLMKGAAGAE